MDNFTTRGFLPTTDPLRAFPHGSPYAVLNDIGSDLPERLTDCGFRSWAERLSLPLFSEPDAPETLPQLHLYYLCVGFLASGYINQTCMPATDQLPASLAIPLCDVCQRLDRPPMLSYDGYA